VKRQLKALLPTWLTRQFGHWFESYAIKSYSQEGEDMVLRRIFEGVDTGFYVDIGAHHPKRFSNTYYFYKKGWRGINIDAMPGSMNRFNRVRPRDINVEAAVAKDTRELTLYIFNDPALNSFDERLARERSNSTYHVVQEIKVATRPLSELLRTYLPGNTKIAFMSIDVEGLDFEVAHSNDWQMFRPAYVLVETYASTIEEVQVSALHKYMVEQRYALVGKTILTTIYKDTLL
jgi:FkbM family methyltransferase